MLWVFLRVPMLLVLVLMLSIYGRSAIAGDTVAEKKHLVMAFASAEEGEPVFRMAEGLVAEIGNRMGVMIELISQPVNRAARSLATGTIDAELSRIRDYGEARPELIRVEETIARISYHAYATKPYSDLDGWQSLAPYRIVHRLGLQYVEEYLVGMDIHALNSTEGGLEFILRGRADLYIETPALVEPLLKTRRKYQEIRRIDPAIAWFDTYTYFSPQGADLAERYSQALKSMKADGTYELLMQIP